MAITSGWKVSQAKNCSGGWRSQATARVVASQGFLNRSRASRKIGMALVAIATTWSRFQTSGPAPSQASGTRKK